MKAKLRRHILHFLLPFNKMLSRIGVKRRMSDFHFSAITEEIQNGDVLLSRRKWEVSNFFIPGFYTHAAIYIVTDHMHTIVESTAKGTYKKSLAKFLFEKDYVCLLRPKFIRKDSSESERIIDQALRYIGRPYDYLFEKGVEAFYCSELIWNIFNKCCINFRGFKVKKTLGVETVTPQDFKESDEYFDLVMEF